MMLKLLYKYAGQVIVLILPVLIGCSSNKAMVGEAEQSTIEAIKCQQAWGYGQLTDAIRNAKILIHIKNTFFCGRAMFASVSMVQINERDTIEY